MQRRLSKTFIYNWLQEDAFGEHMLYKKNSQFGNLLLKKVWTFMLFRRNISRGSLLTNMFFPIYLNFVLMQLRKQKRTRFWRKIANPQFTRFLPRPNLNLIRRSVFKYMRGVFVYWRKRITLKRWKRKIGGRVYRLSKFLSHRKVPGTFYAYFDRSVRRFRWKKRRARYLRARLYEKNNVLRIRKVKRFRARPGRLTTRRYPNRATFSLFSRLHKKIKHKIKLFKKNQRLVNITKSYKLLAAQRRRYRGVFRFRVFRLRRLLRNTKRPGRIIGMLSRKVQRLHLPVMSLNTSKLLRITKISWEQFFYKLKKKYNWLLRQINAFVFRKHTDFAPRVRLFFKSSISNKSKLRLKRKQIRPIIRFRLLKYLQVVESSAQFNKLNYFYADSFSKLNLKYATLLQYMISVLLNSGLFNNGYTLVNLVRRKTFSVNGILVQKNHVLKPWDLITMRKAIRWLTYARLMNFFSRLLRLQPSVLIKSPFLQLPKLFVKKLLKYRKLFRKRRRSPLGAKPRVLNLLKLRNFVFGAPAPYLEVSHKLFVILLHKSINRSTESIVFPNLRGLKSLVPSSNFKRI